MDNNIHTDIVMDPSMILYIEKGTSIYFKHLKKNPNDCVKVIELEEHLLRSILPVIFHLSFSASNSSSLNVKKYFFTKSKDYLTHIFNEFNDTKEKKHGKPYKEMINSIYYILSFFTCTPGFLTSLERSMKNSYSERIYKMMVSDIKKNGPYRIVLKNYIQVSQH
ncbi:hypothetical protein CQT90_20535 [Salmonella enterica]|nr:hypothetical protein [Salmonella enterica]ECX8200782.1 hypothetical protein [Salmonella enterica]